MSIKNQQTARRRRPVLPGNIKKQSQISRRKVASVVVLGDREKTETGFIVLGHKGKNIETYYETMLPGTASKVLHHPKKDRVVRVKSGVGFVILYSDDVCVEKKIEPGDELVLKAGLTYRVSTTSNDTLELYVSQESKYEANLEVLEGCTSTQVPDSVLQSGVREFDHSLPRRGSKAKQQQLQRSGQRIPTGQIIPGEGTLSQVAGRASIDSPRATAAVVNARPSMGSFGEEGAG